MPVERTLMNPPRCRLGPLTPTERETVRQRSPIAGKYETLVNRESAHERLSRPAQVDETPPANGTATPSGGTLSDFLWGTKRRQGMVETVAKQAARTVGSQIGRAILRGVLGGMAGGSRRR